MLPAGASDQQVQDGSKENRGSSFHAKLWRRWQAWLIYGLGSKNSVFCQGGSRRKARKHQVPYLKPVQQCFVQQAASSSPSQKNKQNQHSVPKWNRYRPPENTCTWHIWGSLSIHVNKPHRACPHANVDQINFSPGAQASRKCWDRNPTGLVPSPDTTCDTEVDVAGKFQVAMGEGNGGGVEWDFGVNRGKPLYTGWINMVLLYSKGTIFNVLW